MVTMTQKIEMVAYTAIKFNDNLYPRQSIDRTHINKMASDLANGAMLPPILLDKETFLCVDGRHRSHAYQKIYGANAQIPVIFKTWNTIEEMILEAAERNSTHGKTLSSCDRAHFWTIAKRHGISVEDASNALHCRQTDLERIIEHRLAFSPGRTTKKREPDVALKVSTENMAGKLLTKSQTEANKKLGGMRQIMYINGVLMLVKTNMIDKNNERVMEALTELRDELISFL